jgi:hypothetical protein
MEHLHVATSAAGGQAARDRATPTLPQYILRVATLSRIRTGTLCERGAAAMQEIVAAAAAM